MVAFNHWTESFLGAYATPTLVGREDVLKRIDDVVLRAEAGPQVIALTGDGGIGKTRLLNAALARAAGVAQLQAAGQVVDLYHVQTHTAGGLAREMADVLNASNDLFPTYDRERRNFERLNLLGQGVGVKEQRERMLGAFIDDLRTLAQTRRVVIALDTAERYVYGLNDMPIAIKQTAEAWTWLINALPQCGNVVVLMAGRPAAKMLLDDLTDRPILVTELTVNDFTEEASLAYFEAVSEVARAKGQADVARRVANLPTHVRLMAHRFSGGRPILLALFIDYLSVTPGQLPDILRATEVDKIRLAEAREALEAQIVSRLRAIPMLGETIVALGRLPKGADREILAALLDITEEEARERLQRVQSLSFVKIRPQDQRVFLHDEVYAILQRQVYAVHDDAAQAKAELDILAYYRKQRDLCIQDLDRLYAPAEVDGKTQLDLERLAEVHARRQAILTEIVYYRLRQNVVRGYQRYYRYVRDATRAGDTALDAQLQAELLAFQAEIDAGVPGRTSEGLDRNVVVWAVALRPVLRAFADQNYRLMQAEAERLMAKRTDLLSAGAPIAASALDTWLAVTLTYQGGADNLNRAYDLLTRAIQTFTSLLQSAVVRDLAELTLWRTKASLALAYHHRGYLQRLRGYTQEAVNNYSQAAVLWRQVNIEVELANTLNDMGFATAELGYWSDARDLVQDALQRRRQLGARVPVALSYNTLARIAIHRGDYERAISLSEIALALFRALDYQRGKGMALRVLAEAKRRHSRTDFVPRPDDKINLLRAARQHAVEAGEIFASIGEMSREVEALIEVGCANRDWIVVYRDAPNPYDDVRRLRDEGVKALNQAAQVAGKNQLWLQVDALVDLAWLGMYLKEEALIDDALRRVEQAIPAQYYFNKDTGEPSIFRAEAQVLLWPLIGKRYILRAHRSFEQYLNKHKTETAERHKLLVDTITDYFWGLQYSSLYGDHYIGIRRAKEEIYARFRDFTADEMSAVAGVVNQLEKDWHFGEGEGSAFKQFLKRRALWYS